MITQNFGAGEMAQHARPEQGFPLPIPVPPELVHNMITLCEMLEFIRMIWMRRVTILSGYRSPPYNAMVGGKPDSRHMYAEAADIIVSGILPDEVHHVISCTQKAGKLPLLGGLGKYSSFTHVDIHWIGHLRRWDGTRPSAEHIASP